MNHDINIGDMVRIRQDPLPVKNTWCMEAEGSIGVIVGLAKRLYIPAAKVMVLGEIAEFDLDELEKVCK
jgi:hypothetical protein